MKTTILVGDCLKRLQDLPGESVHCVVTSPPYWGLRAYKGDPGMIGLEPTFAEHLENLVAVFREVRRVLRNDGTLWLNYGDAYAAAGSGGGHWNEAKQNSNSGTVHRKGPTHGFKPKDLMMMPARVAMSLQADGWWLRSEIIWHKPNPMPESVTDRPTSAHEKIFLLSKSGSSLFWTHREFPGVRTQPTPDYVYRNRDTGVENPVEPSNWRELLSRDDPKKKAWRRVNLWVGHDYFYDAEAVRVHTGNGWHGKAMPTHAPEHSEGQQSRDSRTPKDIDGRGARLGRAPGWRKSTEQPSGANLRNVWKIPTAPYKEVHFATFPPKLVEPCIKAGTSEKGCCAECGAQWIRVVGRTGYVGKREPAHVPNNTPTKTDSTGWKPSTRGTNSWLPSCDHDAEPVPAVCLDPFSGAGTVGLVAQRLGRDSILIEISQEYAEMSRDRIKKDQPLFAQVEVK